MPTEAPLTRQPDSRRPSWIVPSKNRSSPSIRHRYDCRSTSPAPAFSPVHEELVGAVVQESQWSWLLGPPLGMGDFCLPIALTAGYGSRLVTRQHAKERQDEKRWSEGDDLFPARFNLPIRLAAESDGPQKKSAGILRGNPKRESQARIASGTGHSMASSFAALRKPRSPLQNVAVAMVGHHPMDL